MTENRPQEQQDFEAYSKRKYEAWKTKQITYDEQGQVQSDARTAEQKALDEYVKSASSDHVFFVRTRGNENQLLSYYQSTQAEVLADVSQCRYNQKGKVGDVIFYQTKSGDPTPVPMLFAGIISRQYPSDQSPYISKWVMIADEKGAGGNITATATATTVESPANAEVKVTNKGSSVDFAFKIPRGPVGPRGPEGPAGPAGAGGGGGSVANIQIPTSAKTNITVPHEGKYALNLFDYRQLSRETAFSMGEQLRKNTRPENNDAGKIFNTRRPKHLAVTKENKVGPFLGIKKKRELKLETTCLLEKTNGQGKFEILIEKKGGNQDKISNTLVTSNPTVTNKHTPDNYGNYYIDFGTGQTLQKAGDYKVKAKLYYGDFVPQGLKREFEFKSYNGYELLSNGKEKDIYHVGTMYDKIERKLGRIKLSDMVLFDEYEVPEEAEENIFHVKVPDDCPVPIDDEDSTHVALDVAGKVITNNLSEIVLSDIIDPSDNKPFFIAEMMPVTKKGTVDEIQWCFGISIDMNEAWKWKKHLLETEILYPLKATVTEHVPHGGFLMRLSNGDTIYSHNYTQIKDDDKEGVFYFHESKTGFPNIKIQKSQVVSIEPINPVPL